MKTYIIAEIGVNHNGSKEIAKKLIDVVKDAGADAVKFQTFKAESLVLKDAPKANYQKSSTHERESQLEMLKKFELSYDDLHELKNYCDSLKIDFLSSTFDIESARFLKDLGLTIFKIPSGEITNFPLLKEIGSYKSRVILSTGMSFLGEIESALEVLTSAGTSRDDIVILHCNTEYPTPYEDVNLRALLTIRDAFKVQVGYSDHTLGIEVSIAAVALGAKVIEKHITVDKKLPGPDHKSSLEPWEFRELVKGIRNIEKALGNGIKRPSMSELNNLQIVRKSIVAKKFIRKGEIFSAENLTTKRPASGINPMRWNEVVGRVAKRDFREGEPIEI